MKSTVAKYSLDQGYSDTSMRTGRHHPLVVEYGRK
jgi:hypothetical protein